MEPDRRSGAPCDRTKTARALSVVIADDDVLLREGLASLIARSGLTVLGQASDAAGAVSMVSEHRPDVVMVDVRMPPTNSTEGLDAARLIREQSPDTGILVLSAHVEAELAVELLANEQAMGYLLKSRVTDVAEFIETLHRIADGGCVVDPELVNELVSARRRENPLAVLSSREHDVLTLMAQGRSNTGIASRLGVAPATVEKHVRSILIKLDLPATDDDHRRVRAVIAFLESQ